MSKAPAGKTQEEPKGMELCGRVEKHFVGMSFLMDTSTFILLERRSGMKQKPHLDSRSFVKHPLPLIDSLGS